MKEYLRKMKLFDKNTIIETLRRLDLNTEGMSYDIMRDLGDVLKKGGHIESANVIDLKMQQLVAKNLFNHEKTYEGIADLYDYLLKNKYVVAAESFRLTLQNLKRVGFATRADLN